MTEPVSLTVGSIAALAFSTFLKSGTEEAAKKIAVSAIEKINALREQIWLKLRGIPAVDQLKTDTERRKQITDDQIKRLTPYLESAMSEDADFCQSIQKVAHDINQLIDIDEVIGKNGQNIYGGAAVQITDPDPASLTLALWAKLRVLPLVHAHLAIDAISCGCAVFKTLITTHN
ncbi:MAG: hypothetical protein AAF311_03630 [Pseudomonadota bacterium]